MMKIKWTSNAKAQLIEILRFYTRRNRSSVYSKRLKKEVLRVVQRIRANPHLGEEAPGYDNRRRMIVGNYVLAYELDENVIYIHSLRDGRRDEENE